MDLAKDAGHGAVRQIETHVFKSIRESEREIHPDRKHGSGQAAWERPVRQAVSTFNPEAYAKELQNRAKERELERKLALKLIDIGYKVLAAQLHPDKRGGSAEAMSRLNSVRTRLKNAA
jgi:hypothetical protein